VAGISKRFGSGGANVAPGGGAGTPTLADALREIADDLSALKLAAVAAPAAAPAAGAAPTQAEFDAVVTLVNELRDKVNAIAAVTLKTTKAG
jgi:hypothetical protein